MSFKVTFDAMQSAKPWMRSLERRADESAVRCYIQINAHLCFSSCMPSTNKSQTLLQELYQRNGRCCRLPISTSVATHCQVIASFPSAKLAECASFLSISVFHLSPPLLVHITYCKGQFTLIFKGTARNNRYHPRTGHLFPCHDAVCRAASELASYLWHHCLESRCSRDGDQALSSQNYSPCRYSACAMAVRII